MRNQKNRIFSCLCELVYLIPHIPQIRKLCEQHKVEQLYAFGSAVTYRFSEDSDVDLIVEINVG